MTSNNKKIKWKASTALPPIPIEAGEALVRGELSWMIWYEDDNPDGYPVQTLTEGMQYFKEKYGNKPNWIEVPPTVDLKLLTTVSEEIQIDVQKTIMHRYIYFTYQPGGEQ